MASRVQVLTLHLACDVTGGMGGPRAVSRRGGSSVNAFAGGSSSTLAARPRAFVSHVPDTCAWDVPCFFSSWVQLQTPGVEQGSQYVSSCGSVESEERVGGHTRPAERPLADVENIVNGHDGMSERAGRIDPHSWNTASVGRVARDSFSVTARVEAPCTSGRHV
jgi:hypothetical protein